MQIGSTLRVLSTVPVTASRDAGNTWTPSRRYPSGARMGPPTTGISSPTIHPTSSPGSNKPLQSSFNGGATVFVPRVPSRELESGS